MLSLISSGWLLTACWGDAGYVMSEKDASLSDREVQLLVANYSFYRSLEFGQRAPSTPAQEHFVAVCAGSASPCTEHEHVYSKFRRLMNTSDFDESTIVASNFRFPPAPRHSTHADDDEADEMSGRPCLECSQLIPKARLLANPDAARCLACQEAFEKGGGDDKPSTRDAGEAWFPRHEHWRYRGRRKGK